MSKTNNDNSAAFFLLVFRSGQRSCWKCHLYCTTVSIDVTRTYYLFIILVISRDLSVCIFQWNENQGFNNKVWTIRAHLDFFFLFGYDFNVAV